MSVFTWSPKPVAVTDHSGDEFQTAWNMPDPVCLFCGHGFERGDRVWGWDVDAGAKVTAHAKCVKKNARGILKDIGERLR